MTSLVAWVGVDQRRQSSLYIASDSRISWSVGGTPAYSWDHGKKVFAALTHPLIVGYVGDVLFPLLVVPPLLERIDLQVAEDGLSPVETLISGIRRGWREYPTQEQRSVAIYIGHRTETEIHSASQTKYPKTSVRFHLTRMSKEANVPVWQVEQIHVPESTSERLAIDGSGKRNIESALEVWQRSSAADTSRALYSGFVDAVVSGKDAHSGGSPQIAGLYRQGPGRLFGIIHKNQRYFAGMPLLGHESTGHVEWRNELFERVNEKTKKRLPGAQPQPRPNSNVEN